MLSCILDQDSTHACVTIFYFNCYSFFINKLLCVTHTHNILAVSIRLDETLYNRTEDAGNVNLTIVRTGATELTQDVSILVTPCGRDELEELLEGLIIV